jgi:hypothetical protein
MRTAGRNVVATDAYGVPAFDFLHDAPPDPKVVALVTNPPFNQLNKFIARALQHLDSGAVQRDPAAASRSPDGADAGSTAAPRARALVLLLATALDRAFHHCPALVIHLGALETGLQRSAASLLVNHEDGAPMT